MVSAGRYLECRICAQAVFVTTYAPGRVAVRQLSPLTPLHVGHKNDTQRLPIAFFDNLPVSQVVWVPLWYVPRWGWHVFVKTVSR